MSDRAAFWRLVPSSGAVPSWAPTVEEAADQLDRAIDATSELVRDDRRQAVPAAMAFRNALLLMDSVIKNYREYSVGGGTLGNPTRSTAIGCLLQRVSAAYGCTIDDLRTEVTQEAARNSDWIGVAFPPQENAPLLVEVDFPPGSGVLCRAEALWDRRRRHHITTHQDHLK